MVRIRNALTFVVLASMLAPAPAAIGDDFDRLSGRDLARLLQAGQIHDQKALSFRDLEALPPAIRDSRSAFLLVKTDLGNLAQMLVSPGFRKRPGGKEPLVPLLLIERFQVFDAGNPGVRLARGKDVMLFPGFQFDLDTGQVVPQDLGGDLLFTAQGNEGGILSSSGTTRIATLDRPATLPPGAAGSPSEGRVVRPDDFSGRYHLVANGQWTGAIELTVDAAGAIAGSFQSDASGSAYPVTGKVDAQLHQKVQFAIQFPRARQEYQGVLWTEGKQAIAGMVSMKGQEFSFLAVRDGAKLDAGVDMGLSDLHAAGKPGETWLRVRIEAEADRYVLGQTPRTGKELKDELARAVKSVPGSKVMIVASDATPFQRLRLALRIIQAAGVATIRLAPLGEEP